MRGIETGGGQGPKPKKKPVRKRPIGVKERIYAHPDRQNNRRHPYGEVIASDGDRSVTLPVARSKPHGNQTAHGAGTQRSGIAVTAAPAMAPPPHQTVTPAPAPPNRHASMSRAPMTLPAPGPYRLAAERAAKKYGVDPRIFLAMIQQESGFNPNARSGAGAQGIAQFMPATAKAYGVNLNDGRVTDDLEGAARYIAANLQRTGGNYHQALSIYNSGRPNAYKDPRFAKGQTYNYVKNILAAAGNGKVQGRGQNGSAGGSVSSTTTTTKTIPGVDNSAQRQQLIAAYLTNTHDPNALTALAAGLLGAKDTPARTVTSSKTTKTGGEQSSGATSAKGLGPLRELFYQGPGGIDVKNGQRQPLGFVSGHTDHVHVASGPKTVVELGRLAQQMGLHVGENPHFGGVDPVHVKTSYHYKGEAIDVSGSPDKMRAFARKVASLYHITK